MNITNLAFGKDRFFTDKTRVKKMTYSSSINCIILSNAVSDEAALTGRTSSEVQEDMLIARYIPADPKARKYVSGVYFGKSYDLFGKNEKKYGIREAMAEICQEESAGIGWRSAHENDRALVEFIRPILAANHTTIQANHFKKQNDPGSSMRDVLNAWDSVCNKIEYALETCDEDKELRFELQQSAKEGRLLEDSLHSNPNLPVVETIDFILRNWEHVGNYTYTYRYLGSLLNCSSDWDDEPVDRMRFKVVCEDVMSEWTRIELEKEEKRAKQREDALLTPYNMANGDHIVVPRGWVVANPEDATLSKYAGVIEVKNGEPYDAPCILFFSNVPPEVRFTDEQRDAIIAMATKAWPRLAEIQAAEVPLEYGRDGGVLNKQAHDKAPIIGVFRIYDKTYYDNSIDRPPAGACIYRARKEATE